MASTDPVVKEIEAARIKLIIEWPIFGSIVLHLELKEVDWCPTAATDGKYFYYNREFVKKLDKAQLLFLTAHEILHCIYDHIFRKGSRDKDLWNMAADFIVNWTLIHTFDSHKKAIGRKIENVPPVTSICYDPEYTDEFSVEELYALLEKKQVKIQMPLDMHLDGDGGDGDGQPKEGKGQAQDGDKEGDGEGDKDGKGKMPKLSQEEKDTIRENIRASLIQAAQQQANFEPGSVPAGIQRLIDRLLEPKIDWRQMLDTVLRSAIKYDYTYTKKSRRSYSTNIILPGRNIMDKVVAMAFLDGSGSTTKEMVTDFLSECKGIMNTFRDFELTIATFDTKIYGVTVYTPDNTDEIDDYPFQGGGGTAPSCCWDYMKENEIKPHKILLFTDGYVGNDWGEEDYADTLFIIHSNPRVTAPYGQTCHYEPRG